MNYLLTTPPLQAVLKQRKPIVLRALIALLALLMGKQLESRWFHLLYSREVFSLRKRKRRKRRWSYVLCSYAICFAFKRAARARDSVCSSRFAYKQAMRAGALACFNFFQ